MSHCVLKLSNTDRPTMTSTDRDKNEESTSTSQSQTNGNDNTQQSTFQKFTNIIHKSFQKSHKAIDTLAIIEECYGEDAAIFADSKEEGQTLLAGLLDAALYKIDNDVKNEADRLVRQEAELTLNHLDQAVGEINKREQLVKEAEEHDRKSAQDALRMSKLPDGITSHDIMSYQAYLIKIEMRDTIVSQLQTAKEECDDLSKKVEERKELVHAKIKGLEDVHQNLGKAADVCSFSGVS
jgi:hypothetical protein